MYIWGINCNIYKSYSSNYLESSIIDNILYNSFHKLKLYGKVFFPVAQTYEYEKNIEYFEKKSSQKYFSGFTFSIESIDNFPYIISKNVEQDFEIKEYYVFTKNET